MVRVKALRWIPLLAGCALSSPPVRAQGANPTPGPVDAPSASRVGARGLMREGNRAYAAGDISTAYGRYLAAWNQAKGFDIACNLGRAALELGRARDAAQYLEYCLQHYSLSSREEVVQAEREIRGMFEQARSRVGAVSIRVTPPGAEILVDGKRFGRDPLESSVFLDAGKHHVEARLSGYRAKSIALPARAGEASIVSLRLDREEPRSAPASSVVPENPKGTPEKQPIGSYVPALVTGSVAVAGFATGVGVLVASLARDSARESELASLPGSDPCGAGTPHVVECTKIQGMADDARAFRTVSFVAFGLGAANLAATYFLWPRAGKTSPQVGVRVLPFIGSQSAGAFAHGAF